MLVLLLFPKWPITITYIYVTSVVRFFTKEYQSYHVGWKKSLLNKTKIWSWYIGFVKLHRAAHISIISSTFSNIDIGSSFAKILNVFIFLIICSTKILSLSITSAGFIWEAPRLPEGTIKVIFLPAHSSNKLICQKLILYLSLNRMVAFHLKNQNLLSKLYLIFGLYNPLKHIWQINLVQPNLEI